MRESYTNSDITSIIKRKLKMAGLQIKTKSIAWLKTLLVVENLVVDGLWKDIDFDGKIGWEWT